MIAIETYTNAKCELYIAKARLCYLNEKKQDLINRYLSIAATIKEVAVSSSHNDDKLGEYICALNEVDSVTGKSLEDEIDEQVRIVNRMERYITEMEKAIKKMNGIEIELFREIIINGTKITKAVEKTAEKYDRDIRTIWRVYNKNIKSQLKKLYFYKKKN